MKLPEFSAAKDADEQVNPFNIPPPTPLNIEKLRSGDDGDEDGQQVVKSPYLNQFDSTMFNSTTELIHRSRSQHSPEMKKFNIPRPAEEEDESDLSDALVNPFGFDHDEDDQEPAYPNQHSLNEPSPTDETESSLENPFEFYNELHDDYMRPHMPRKSSYDQHTEYL